MKTFSFIVALVFIVIIAGTASGCNECNFLEPPAETVPPPNTPKSHENNIFRLEVRSYYQKTETGEIKFYPEFKVLDVRLYEKVIPNVPYNFIQEENRLTDKIYFNFPVEIDGINYTVSMSATGLFYDKEGSVSGYVGDFYKFKETVPGGSQYVESARWSAKR